MHRLIVASALLLLASFNGLARAADNFIVLSYHEIEDFVPKEEKLGRTVVSLENLKAQFAWLKQNGYRVISVQELLDAKAGKKKLPEKAVMLTFDDGDVSFYTKAFPLLKQYRYPAMIALVTSWMDVPEDGFVEYDQGQEPWKRNAFLSWAQVKEVVKSGLVEVASHSHDMHHGLLGNPQGNTQPAAVTHVYDPATQRYEDDAAYAKRVSDDLHRTAAGIQQHLGMKPRAIVWPYGEFNRPLVEAAKAEGMTLTFELADGRNRLDDLSAIKRLLVAENPDIDQFADMVTTVRADRPVRVMHVDLDYIYDPDPAQTEKNLGALLDRMREIHPNTVYLQAYSDPDGDGNADALYFPNRHLPMRADLFNRVAWQMKTRNRVKVYAWMPVLAYKADLPADWYVHEWKDGKPQLSSHIYKRLSPFHPEARRFIGEIYEDLAKHASFVGLLFHDDAILSDYEDVSPAALSALARTDLPRDFDTLHGTAPMRMKWAQFKTQALNDFTLELANRVRLWRPDLKTARNLYALPLLQPDSEEWYAQNFDAALKTYDYVAIEAMPLMEEAKNPEAWLTELVLKAALHPDGLRKTVFELQGVDWRHNNADIPMDMFAEQWHRVEELGGQHLGYYPDNVFKDQPKMSVLRDLFVLPAMP